MKDQVQCLVPAEPSTDDLQDHETNVIREAIDIIESRIRTTDAFSTAEHAVRFCQFHLAEEKDECFCVLFLDTQHRLIAFEHLFRGTVDRASVYPRVVARRALELNAGAVILTHNHPSGATSPSAADEAITQRVQDALNLIDVRVLDHIIVGHAGTTSLLSAGML